MLGLLILAQGRGEQEVGGAGPGLAIIAGVLVLLVLGAVALHFLLHRGAKRSRGGVQPPPDEAAERHPGAPPFESIERRS